MINFFIKRRLFDSMLIFYELYEFQNILYSSGMIPEFWREGEFEIVPSYFSGILQNCTFSDLVENFRRLSADLQDFLIHLLIIARDSSEHLRKPLGADSYKRGHILPCSIVFFLVFIDKYPYSLSNKLVYSFPVDYFVIYYSGHIPLIKRIIKICQLQLINNLFIFTWFS